MANLDPRPLENFSMWVMLQRGGQKSNIPALKQLVDDWLKMATHEPGNKNPARLFLPVCRVHAVSVLPQQDVRPMEGVVQPLVGQHPQAGAGSDRKEVQGMTRKRFVKLLMAERFDRNEANLWADYYNTAGVSYVDAYKEMEVYRAVLELCNKAFLLLADAAEEAQKSFSELGNALREVNI